MRGSDENLEQTEAPKFWGRDRGLQREGATGRRMRRHPLQEVAS